MILPLRKITHILHKPFIVLVLLMVLFPLLLGAKALYDKLREPDVYKPREEVNFTFPIGSPLPNQSIQVKKPGVRALLPGAKWVPQSFNNCAPATTSMVLQYFGFSVSQEETKAELRTNADDKNVFTYEIAEYLKTKYDIDSKLLYGGDIELLKTLVANGFYVVVEDWLHPNEDIGHVTIIRGFDDEEGVFIADDSFIGTNITYPYEQFDKTQWKAFNREYLPVYKPGNEGLLKAIVGESWNEEKMYEKAAQTAREEIAVNDQDMYAWFNLGTSLYALKEYKEAEKSLFYAPNFKRAQEFLTSFTLTSFGAGQVTASSDVVLGATDFGPVSGTPIIPPSYLTLYFVIYLAFLFALYLYFHHKKRPMRLWHKLRLFVVLAVILKASIVVGGGLLALYWLLPPPQIRRTIPPQTSSLVSPTKRIEIVFDRPINRGTLTKSISPEIPGRFVFEDSLYTTHLYRKLVFYPTYSFRPGTTYTIKLSGIRNFISISEPYSYQFSFTTMPSPGVAAVEPLSGKTGVDINTDISVKLDNPNENISEFTFLTTPQFTYDVVLDSSKKTYTLNPKTPLKQGTSLLQKLISRRG